MKARLPRRSAALAAVLIVLGAVLLLVGVWTLASPGRDGIRARRTAEARLLPTAGPPPTEPILPPPPTASATSIPTTTTPVPAPSLTQPTAARTTAPPSAPAAAPPLPTATGPPPTAAPTSTPTPSPTATRTAPVTATAPAGLYTLRQRLGVCAQPLGVDSRLAGELGLGWYLDWGARPGSFRSEDVAYVPMIHLRDGKTYPSGEKLESAVRALPGALWLIGNEPDVKWQDNTPPRAYAQLYHDLYARLKAIDPTCQIAIGGVSQPTPLRLRYLDLVLAAYQELYGQAMPVDVWNVHNFILREERDSWGVDIPPGMSEQTGVLREIADHDSMEIFRQQMIDLRRWMKERGQQDKPLIVTEYGVLMPTDYGFPPEQVEQFMLATFEFFESATDPELGYPADGYRLVQRWSWFSLTDELYATGDLVQADNGSLTRLGEAFARHALAPR